MSTRRYSTADRMIINLDRAVRSLQGRGSSSGRPSPAEGQDPDALSARDRRTSASLMRVNHAGEVAAQALYHGQALISSDPELRHAMEQAAREEEDHLRWCRDRIDDLGGRTSVLDPFWYAGALTFGAIAGLAGDRINLGFLAETEHQVVAHLDDHLSKLPAADLRSRAVLEQMRLDEAAHARTAEQRGAAELPTLVKRAMRFASRVMTRTAYLIWQRSQRAKKAVDADSRMDLVSLLRAQRWGALATVGDDGQPLASSVAYALAPGARGFLLHLSRLAEHTRNMLKRPGGSLIIGEPDHGDGDPQTLARFSVQGLTERLQPGSPAYADARAAYTARLPNAEQRFGFADFELFLLTPVRGQYVGGFARAFALDADGVVSVLKECLSA